MKAIAFWTAVAGAAVAWPDVVIPIVGLLAFILGGLWAIEKLTGLRW